MKSQATEFQKFSSDIVWIAVSQGLIFLTGLVAIPALTKSYNSELYGVWSQINITVALLTPILILHLSTAFVRFFSGQKNKDQLRRAYGTMLCSIAIFAFIIMFLSLGFRRDLSMFLFADVKYAAFVLIAFLWASIKALFSFSLSYFRARGKLKGLSVIRSISTIARMGLIITLALAGFSLLYVVVCLVVVEALFVVVIIVMITKEIGLPKPSAQALKKYLAFSLPQIPSGILLWVINFSDRYFITHFLDLSQTGIYAVSYTLGMSILFLFMPLNLVLFPYLSRFWEAKEILKVRKYFENSMKLYLGVAIPTVAGLYFLSQPIIHYLATSEYMARGFLVLFIASGILFYGVYHINSYLILQNQRTIWWLLIDSIGAATNIGLNIVLIPKIGIIAAAISTFASFSMLAIITSFWARRVMIFRLDFKFIAKVFFATLIMGFCIKFVKVDSIFDIVLTIIAGVGLFGIGLFIMNAFSTQDKRMLKEYISSLSTKF